MEDSFKVRVDRVFGSLMQQTLPSSSTSPWTLTDAEVERREWNRDRGESPDDRENILCATSFETCFNPNRRNRRKVFEDDPEELDEDKEERGRGGLENQSAEEEDYEGEIRSSVGLDATLDNEDEEDEYDKVAVGRENAGERVYMRDITDHGPYLNSHNVIPDSFEEIRNARRDPRANHLAARARLREDDKEAVRSFDPHQGDDDKPAVLGQVKETDVKPILKRKENQIESKSKKRVRFDPRCIEDNDKLEQDRGFLMVTQSMESASVEEMSPLLSEDVPQVPDYIRNPSKIVSYTLESLYEDDHDSNMRAYQDLRNMVKASTSIQSDRLDGPATLPKQVTFTPRKKVGDSTMGSTSDKQSQEDASESTGGTFVPVGIAAGEAQDSEICAMEEDDPFTSGVNKAGSSRKRDRQYRLKASSDDSTG